MPFEAAKKTYFLTWKQSLVCTPANTNIFVYYIS